MRITKMVFSLAALLFLGACGQTGQGVKADIKDWGHWMSSRPSHMEKKMGKFPTGYAGHNPRGVVLKPPATQALAWNEVAAYDAVPPMVAGQEYNEDVTVYPVEGGPVYYADAGYPPPVTYYDYGQLVQQLFFAHGSASINSADRSGLVSFGSSLQGAEGVSLTVVSHASKRVNGVSDPVRKKEINFEMAQKRANAVTMALKNAGVNPAWIEAISKGDEEPNPNPGGMSQEDADRRAEVFMRGR